MGCLPAHQISDKSENNDLEKLTCLTINKMSEAASLRQCERMLWTGSGLVSVFEKLKKKMQPYTAA